LATVFWEGHDFSVPRVTQNQYSFSR